MFGTILKATNSSFKKGMTYCRSIYVTKVLKLLAFIFEQPSYNTFQISNIKGAGWLAPLLLVCNKIRFSRDKAHMVLRSF